LESVWGPPGTRSDRIRARPGAWSSPTCAYARPALTSQKLPPVCPIYKVADGDGRRRRLDG